MVNERTDRSHHRTVDFISTGALGAFDEIADCYGISRMELMRLVILRIIREHNTEDDTIPAWMKTAQLDLMEERR